MGSGRKRKKTFFEKVGPPFPCSRSPIANIIAQRGLKSGGTTNERLLSSAVSLIQQMIVSSLRCIRKKKSERKSHEACFSSVPIGPYCVSWKEGR